MNDNIATRTIAPGLEDALDEQLEREGSEAMADKVATLMASLHKPPVTAEQKIIDAYGVGFLQAALRRYPDLTAEELLEGMEAFASDFARTINREVCLVLSRRLRHWFNRDGNKVKETIDAFGKSFGPSMRLNGSANQFLSNFVDPEEPVVLEVKESA